MKTAVAQILANKGSEVWSVSPDTLLYTTLQLMEDKGAGALAVLNEKGALIGMVSERDYARKVILEGRSSRENTTGDIMTNELYVVKPETTVDECIALMTEKRVRHLPVLDRGKLVGLVSIGDVVKAIITEQRIDIKFLSEYIMRK